MMESGNHPLLVELAGVSKYYPDGDVRALQDINLSIQTGEFLTVVGPSGCGKSTLLHILGGLDLPSQGEVRFQGTPVGECNLNKLRSRLIGFVFQSFYLLPNLTALENVQLPMFGTELSAAQRIERAQQLLNIVGLQKRLHHLPNQLSVGQRQRIAIARALANNPVLILADEPTGSLDSSSGREVMELLIRLNQQEQTGLVVVTHDASVAQNGSRQIRMLDGSIVEDSQAMEKAPQVSLRSDHRSGKGFNG